jgi:3-deoxy-D-manno-octulosonic-acid transferase
LKRSFYPLYNLILHLATIGGAPFIIPFLAIKEKHRKGLAQRLGCWPKELIDGLSEMRPLWYHAVSVGEVMASITLIQRIKMEFPDLPILFSTVTVTGNKMALSKLKEINYLVYFPFDYPFIVKKVIGVVNPIAFITTETEIWPNFMRCLGKMGVPIILVNGRISPKSFKRYRRFKPFFQEVLKNISIFCMQSQINADRIATIGADPERIIITGNLKFDMKLPEMEPIEVMKMSFHLNKDENLIIAGSTHKGEEEIILRQFEILKKEFIGLRLIIAPRSPDRFDEVEGIIRSKSHSYIRRTWLEYPHYRENRWEVMLLDTIGELRSMYILASLVFIGGSLVPAGGHNPLEAVIHRKPVLFGPFMFNFPEIAQVLKERGGCIQVENGDELLHKMRILLGDPQMRRSIGEAGYKVLEENRGAVERHIQALKPFLESHRCMQKKQ